jgi:hypothetical protein
MQRGGPVGVGESEEPMTESFKASVYEEIKNELRAGNPNDWATDDEDELDVFGRANGGEPGLAVVYGQYNRQHDGLLREFGW